MIYEDEDNWFLFNDRAHRPLLCVPKAGELLSLEIMVKIFHQLRMDDETYFELLRRVTR